VGDVNNQMISCFAWYSDLLLGVDIHKIASAHMSKVKVNSTQQRRFNVHEAYFSDPATVEKLSTQANCLPCNSSPPNRGGERQAGPRPSLQTACGVLFVTRQQDVP
jgi:hypothetical protein